MKVLFVVVLPLALFACSSREKPLQEMRGETMGTRFQLKWSGGEIDEDTIRKGLQDILARYEAELSNWNHFSWVTQFNRQQDTDWRDAPPTVIHVLEKSQRVYRQTQGAFDVTVSPLVELWGFGSSKVSGIPSDVQIAEVMTHVGMDQLEIDSASGHVRKLNPMLTINCSAIAKGHAVDDVADWLQAQGVKHYMIEIGGELRVMGHPPGKEAWTIGILKPGNDLSVIQEKVVLQSGAMATSGDYLNFTQIGGEFYPHIINPSTGRPVKHRLRSVTIVGKRCATSDALATACLVMGTSRALDLIESLQGYEAYLIEQHEDGSLRVIQSSHF
ncbi:MAG: FAD:protein FMN transferase [Verrucomicrobiae bacterium]|nr:FAD:protein FMN transferase [Verrucomicrobiae bacterium]NNJ42076.1 FAD:protein FMN transferase [Akkermansiaceae bacterium]